MKNKSTQTQANAVPFTENYILPQKYGNTYLTLISRDPYWLHAYWEISDKTVEEIRNMLGDEINCSTVVLRLYDVTLIDFNGCNANHYFDIDVGPYASNWYINLWSDNVSYCADIGYRTPSGRFINAARSNVVKTQRRTLSDRNEMIWLKVDDESRGTPYAHAEKRSLSKNAQNALASKRSTRIKYHLTEQDIKAYYANIFPLLRRIKWLKGLRRNGLRSGLNNLKDEGYVFEKSLIDGSVFYKKVILGASAEMVLRLQKEKGGGGLGASESFQELFSGASENVVRQHRKFYFEIGTELIVYGRTEPDAEVWMGQKKIDLKPDGTFGLRFALPDDTTIPLDFKAVSGDKAEERTIRTSGIRKKTFYCP